MNDYVDFLTNMCIPVSVLKGSGRYGTMPEWEKEFAENRYIKCGGKVEEINQFYEEFGINRVLDENLNASDNLNYDKNKYVNKRLYNKRGVI